MPRGLFQRDEDYCSAVIAEDEEVALLERQVDRAGTNVLIRFQPLASLRDQMEPLAESARDLMEKFGDVVGQNPEGSEF
jgi:hypothetical protein